MPYLDSGYDYYEPVYYEPIYEPLPPPPPVPPAPIQTYETPPYIPPIETVAYQPPVYVKPVIFPEPELPYGTGLWLAPGQSYAPAPLVGPTPQPVVTPAPVFTDAGWAFCANEHQRCNFPDTREVRYGKGSTWTAPRLFTGGVDCSNSIFGDPLFGTVKECQTRAVVPEPLPTPVIAEKPMAEDFYLDDYNGGGFYNGGGADVFLNGGGGGFAPIDYAPYEPVPLESPEFFPLPVGDFEPIPYAPYEPVPLESPEFFPLPVDGFEPVPFAPYEPVALEPPVFDQFETYQSYLDFYMSMGVDPNEAADFASEATQALTGSILIPGIAEKPETPPVLPELSPYTPIPYITPFTPWETPLIIPELETYFPLPPPPPKLGPCSTPDGLPGPCAGGFYHPLNNPCACVPFPPAPRPPAQTQQPKPPAQTQSPAPKPPAQQPKPPTQQQTGCPQGQWRNPQTGRCEPIPKCTSPGTVFDQRTGKCVPTAQAQLPSTTTQEEPEEEKSNWWMWALIAGAGLIALSDSGGGKRR